VSPPKTTKVQIFSRKRALLRGREPALPFARWTRRRVVARNIIQPIPRRVAHRLRQTREFVAARGDKTCGGGMRPIAKLLRRLVIRIDQLRGYFLLCVE